MPTAMQTELAKEAIRRQMYVNDIYEAIEQVVDEQEIPDLKDLGHAKRYHKTLVAEVTQTVEQLQAEEFSSLTKLKNTPNLNGWDFSGIIDPEHSEGQLIYAWYIERPEGRGILHNVIVDNNKPVYEWYGNNIAVNMQKGTQ